MVKQVLNRTDEKGEKKKDANKANPSYQVSGRFGVPMEDNTLPYPLESVPVDVRRQMDKRNPGQ